jgi:hypothetical protein
MSNFMKTPSVKTEFFHADGSTDTQTDMTELIVNFRNVAKMPKNLKQTKHVRGTQIKLSCNANIKGSKTMFIAV